MGIDTIKDVVERNGIIFLTYGGFLSQSLISSMTEALEKETNNNDVSMGISNNIFTIFIELSQNMMKYSKSKDENCRKITPEGLIVVLKDKNGNYQIDSQNVISIEDKVTIEPVLEEIKLLGKDELKKRYRELRRSGENAHEKGGGIGFYEIAKRCDKIDYSISKINDDKYYFNIKTYVNKDKGTK